MKTNLTKKIERALIHKYCSGTFKTHYGALEVPVDYSLGKGKQNVDFALYDPKNQDLSCFEIKVSKSDFNSNASLSFIGNKNYLVASADLAVYLKENWHNQKERQLWTHSDLPLHGIGLMSYDEKQDNLSILINARHHDIHLAQKISLLEGILRAGCRDAEKAYLNGLCL